MDGEPLYHALRTCTVWLSPDAHLWFTKSDSKGELVTDRELQLLSQCVIPRTMEDHARTIASTVRAIPPNRGRFLSQSALSRLVSTIQSNLQSGPKQQPDRSEIKTIKHELNSLLSRGLLTRLQFDSLTSHHGHSDISTIGIITKGRPAELARSVSSHLRGARRFDRLPRLCIVDGSSDERACRETEEVIRTTAAQYEGEVVYIGPKEKAELVSKLTHVAPLDVLEFSFIGIPGVENQTGANRNCLMISVPNDAILSVDDDTENCSLRMTSLSENRIRFTSSSDIQEYVFPRISARITEFAEDTPSDPFANHELLLGRCVSDILCGSSSTFEWATPVSSLLSRALAKDSQFCVGISFSGIIGSSGTWSSAGLLDLTGNSKSNLLRSLECYERAVSRDEIMRCTLQLTVTDNAWCMTTAYAIDHRIVALPFLPAFRNQDGLFGAMCRYCFPRVLFGHARSVVRHTNPDSPRRPSLFVAGTRIRIADLLQYFVPLRQDGTTGLLSDHSPASLGAYWRDISRLCDSDLRDHLLAAARSLLSNRFHRWHELLAESTHHRTLHNDVSEALRKLQIAIAEPTCWIPMDMPIFVSNNDGIRFMRTVFRQFGSLLEYWSSILEASRQHTKHNISFGRRLH